MNRSLLLVLVVAVLWGSHCASNEKSVDIDSGAGDSGAAFGDAEITSGETEAETGAVDKCHVPPDSLSGNAPVCMKPAAPPSSFSPKTKWTWDAPPPLGEVGIIGSMVTPLVGNFTDDNNDGEVNLCDIPDVIVTTNGGLIGSSGKIFMLAGDTGKLEVTFEGIVDGSVTPAFGDVDGDGKPEVVTVDLFGRIVIYDEKGKIQTVGPDQYFQDYEQSAYCMAIAIANLDAVGPPEIIAGFSVFDNTGKRKFHHDVAAFQGMYFCSANTAADLDGDGKLEVIFGNAAYTSNGQKLWSIPGPPGQPQVANLDSDPDPEIYVARADGLLVLEHTGQIKFGPVKPFNEPDSAVCWGKAAAVHDFDGDGIADLNASTCSSFGVMKVTPSTLQLLWSVPVDDSSGIAASTAFDFLGSGIASAVYGDQVSLLVLDGKSGAQYLKSKRFSGTLIEYPVVADVDNDNSADIVVVSNDYTTNQNIHTVEVLEDAQKRWIPTRRIWNQHTYHVTNVREDGTIPQKETKSWTKLNTFRTNAQIEGGGDCAPPPPNPPK